MPFNDSEFQTTQDRLTLDRLEKNDPTLTELDFTVFLFRHAIGVEGAKALAHALESNTTLLGLDLSNNKIGDEGAKALALALKSNTTLSELDLKDNEIGDEGAQALAHALESNTTLSKLSLWSNEIGVEGAQALAHALESNTTLSGLDLNNNKIGDEGAQALAHALESNTTLSLLSLYSNEIGVKGAQALAPNTTLSLLSLFSNEIGVEGAQALAHALESNTTLAKLYLDNNKIGDEGAQAILTALKDYNSTLKSIGLPGNDVSVPLKQEIEDLVKANEKGTRTDLNNDQQALQRSHRSKHPKPILVSSLYVHSILTTEVLGEGFFGTVCRGYDKVLSIDFAVKSNRVPVNKLPPEHLEIVKKSFKIELEVSLTVCWFTRKASNFVHTILSNNEYCAFQNSDLA